MQLIAGEDGLLEKRPQAVGRQKESFDFIGGPNAEGSSAAGGPLSIVAEDAPSADRFPAQMHWIIATQKPVPNQASDLFAMRASRRFQLGEHLIDFLLGTTNPAHDDLTPYEQTSLIRGQHADTVSQIVARNKRRGRMSMTREAGCEGGLQGAGYGVLAAGCWSCQIKGATNTSN